jgi:hypothetical protein
MKLYKQGDVVAEVSCAAGFAVVGSHVHQNGKALNDRPREAGDCVIRLDGYGATGPILVVHTLVRRKELEQLIRMIEGAFPKTFCTVEELCSASFNEQYIKIKGGFNARLPVEGLPCFESRVWLTPA